MSSPLGKEVRGSNPGDLPAQSAGTREPGSTRPFSAVDWNRDVVLHTRDLLCIHDLKGKLLSINPEPARVLGYTVEELLRIPMREMLPLEFRPQFEEYLEKIARDGEAHGLLTLATRSGEKRVWGYHNTIQRAEGAEPVVHGIAHDVTEQKRIEHELRKSEEQLRLFIEHAPAGLAMFDREMRYIEASRRWRDDYGLGDRDLLGVSHYEVFPEIPEGWKEAHRRGLGGEIIREECDRFDRADGSVQWVRWEIRPWRDSKGNVGGIVIFAEEITERKEAERALRKSEAELREAQRLGRIGSWYRDLKTDTLTWTEQIDCVLGPAPKAQPLTFKQSESFFTPESWQRIVRNNSKLLSAGGRDELEVEFRRQDGTMGWAITHREAVRDEAGQLVGIRGVGLDITERKRAEEALRRSELRYRLLFEKGIAGVVITSLEGRIIQCNDAWAQMFGFKDAAEAVVSKGIDRWPDPAERSAFIDEIRRCGSILNRERQFRRKNGDVFWGFVNSVLVDGEDGPCIQSTVLDITEHKRAEAALQQSETKFKSLFETANDAILISQGEAFSDCNLRAEILFGCGKEDIVGHSPHEFSPPTQPDGRRSAETIAAKVQAAMMGSPQVFEWRHIRHDGTPFDAEVSLSRVITSEAEYLLGSIRDISERKRAEEALRESEARERAHAKELETILDTLPIPVLIAHDPQCTLITANRAGYEHLRLPQGTNVSLTAWQEHKPHRFVQDGVEVTSDKLPMDRAVATGRAVRGVNTKLVFADGEERYELGNAAPLFDEKGQVRGAVGAALDITERIRTEEALRQAERKYRTIFDNAVLGIFQTAPEGHYLSLNRALAHMFGYASPEEKMAATTDIARQEFVDPSRRQELVLRLEDEGMVQNFVYEICRKDGSRGWVSLSARVVRDEQGKTIFYEGMQEDISERVRAGEALRESEERLRMAQEVANIGTFDRDLLTGESQWTPQMRAIYGLSADAPSPTLDQVVQLTHPEDRQSFSDLLAHSMESGEGGGEWRIVWPDGTVRWIAGRWRIFKDPSGKPARMIGIDYDITDRKRIEEELRQAKEKLTEEKHYFEHAIDTEMGFEEIIGSSSGMRSVMEQVSKVATSDATVLLLGETGVGKELVARALHRLSLRKNNSFIKMNCAAIPSGLLESELFGAEKGAYTGSVSRKIGRMELADKGTIFLDEIGDIALLLQPKLLRVLQDQEFERLGGTQTIKVNFRLIAATNRDLAEEVRNHQFRSDLFYRLNVFPIHVPALRERRDDIPLLVEYFVKKIGRRLNKLVTSVPRRTLNELCAWDWPGNVRELENFIERSVILSPGSVLAAPLSELRARTSVPAGQAHTLEAAERKIILEALRLANGRISGQRGAAIRLGLKRTTLQSKLKQLGINPRTLPPN